MRAAVAAFVVACGASWVRASVACVLLDHYHNAGDWTLRVVDGDVVITAVGIHVKDDSIASFYWRYATTGELREQR